MVVDERSYGFEVDTPPYIKTSGKSFTVFFHSVSPCATNTYLRVTGPFLTKDLSMDTLSLNMFMTRLTAALLWRYVPTNILHLHFEQMFLITKEGTFPPFFSSSEVISSAVVYYCSS